MKKISLWLITFIFIATLTHNSFSQPPVTIQGAKTITAEELFILRKDPKLVIIDVRPAKQFKHGHIADAHNLLSTKFNQNSLKALAPTKQTPLAIYCTNTECRRAAQAVTDAVNLGYKKVYYYYGGLADWQAQNFPLEKH